MEKTVSELEQPIVDLEVDQSAVDKNTTTKYGRGRVHVHARAQMPEKQLFSYAEYEAKAAEYTGSSEYSYWKSVWRSFLKKRAAVGMLIIFLLLFIFPGVCAFYGNSLRCEITENTRLLAAVQSRVPESLTDLFRLKASALTAGSFLYFL